MCLGHKPARHVAAIRTTAGLGQRLPPRTLRCLHFGSWRLARYGTVYSAIVLPSVFFSVAVSPDDHIACVLPQ